MAEFAGVSVSDISASASGQQHFVAAACFDPGQLRLRLPDSVEIRFDLKTAQVLRLSAVALLFVTGESKSGNEDKNSFSRALKFEFGTENESRDFCSAVEKCRHGKINGTSEGSLENGTVIVHKSKFDDKIEPTSAKMYFHYYGQLLHQQNMLQDYVRTGTYYAAVVENRIDFNGRVVVDVGAGSGILSLFAAQAGAKHVYAVEASEMAEYARKLIDGNPSLRERITVVKGKVEEIDLPEKADILISEPMGTLLVNERMLESYVIARDRFLASNGKMFPSIGRIHMAPFSDEYLYVEIANKPVVDAFDPRLLVSPPTFHTLNFTNMKEEELYEIDIPLNYTATVGTRVHGLACWFDVLFDGSSVQRWLSTAPGSPTTHWYQLRCVLSQPLYVMAGQEITGRLLLVAHSAQSYTIYLTMSVKMWGPGAEQGGILQTSTGKLDLKEPYYRLSQPQPYAWAQDQQQPQQQISSLDLSPQIQDAVDPALMQQSSPNSTAL
ncbi:Protein arginine N-methyltransferase protein [Dioscorea alata]|uniref:Protein arginine N-methyltransferase protein n=1 Tax=Dioscorea alata TaxID=55571 RepID=A0ACB7VPZ2_DIOAL|nr:Protein arginine N-methyltransferase protein [Dioscorea alata]